MMFAVLNIDKPRGLTSHDVVAKIRRCFGLKKVGHAGTLDPMATGVLPVCLGQATRLLEYFPTHKAYRLEITFGMTTDTLDAEGTVTEQQPVHVVAALDIHQQKLQTLCDGMQGVIEQKIPVYSAKKIQGKKLYEMARAGMTVESPTKTVTIHQIQVISVSRNSEGYPVAVVDVECGSGTFMRAIARDLGDALGCGAYLTGLTRTRHGCFDIDQSVCLETLTASEFPAQYMQLPLDFLELPIIHVQDSGILASLCHGQNILQRYLMKNEPGVMAQLKEHSVHNNAMILVRCDASDSVVVAQWKNNALKPHKVLHQVLKGNSPQKNKVVSS